MPQGIDVDRWDRDFGSLGPELVGSFSALYGRDQDLANLARASVPTDPGVAVVGHYLCFVLDRNGVPSVGRFIQICPAGGGSRSGGSRTVDYSDLFRDLLDQLRRELIRMPKDDPWPLRPDTSAIEALAWRLFPILEEEQK